MQQQHSYIFEPLFPFQLAAHNMDQLMHMERQTHEHAFISQCAPPHSWFTETPPPSTPSCIGITRASCSSFPIMSSNLAMHNAKLSSTLPTRNEPELPSSHSIPKAHDDDGSVASKLLSSITKSISSPSLQLASSKEVARETPYQKSLKLKQMKLQHCSEALGMESSDSSASSLARSIQHYELDMIANLSSCSSTVQPKISNQEYSLTSVQVAPSLSAPPMMMTRQHSKYMRCTSFPPPLSHTLPASPPSSCNSLSPSLRPYRQDGRLILKEVMVPSRNYFQANRKDGRLTLRVLTREDEDEGNSAIQHHQKVLISSESCELEDAIVKPEDMTPNQSMISLDQTTQLEIGSCDNEIVCTNRIHPLVDAVSVKASVDSVKLLMGNANELPTIAAEVVAAMKRVCIATHGDRCANIGIAAANDLLSLKTMQCINVVPRGLRPCLGNPVARNVKSNVISNVIALSLQATNHSKLIDLQKAQVLNSFHSSSYPLSSGSMKQSTSIHRPGKSHLLPSSHHDMNTFPESKENFIWESNLMPCVAVASRRKSGIQRGENASSFVLEEMNANSLLEMVTGLATVGVSYDVRDLCTLASRRKPSSDDNNINLTDAFHGDLESSTIVKAYNALHSAVMGGGISSQEEYIASCRSGFNTHLASKDHDEEKASIGIDTDKEVSLSSCLYSASALPTPPPASATNYLQSDEWLHSLHCKEVSDRNKFGICNFMKPAHSCIATRS